MKNNITSLQEVKDIAIKIRNGNIDSGTHYLLGYVWATLTPKQQNETALSFVNELLDKLELEKKRLEENA